MDLIFILFIIILVGISGYKIHEFRTNLQLVKKVTMVTGQPHPLTFRE
jgi:hypothetical protein